MKARLLPMPVVGPATPSDEERIERIPLVCTFDEANAILRLSRSTGERMRAAGTYPVPELTPPLDNRPRFSGEDILRAIRTRADFGRDYPRRRR